METNSDLRNNGHHAIGSVSMEFRPGSGYPIAQGSPRPPLSILRLTHSLCQRRARPIELHNSF